MVNINKFQKIIFKNPKDLILFQLRDLIQNGQLNPGDKLPSQDSLAKRLGVKRNQVRDTLMKLEFFEIIKNKPQNGTYLSDIGQIALIELITNILNEQKKEDFDLLIDARRIVESRIAQLVAKNATNDDIEEIIYCHKEVSNKIHSGVRGLDEDIFWHLKLAGFSNNYFLKKIMMFLAPQIIEYSRKYTVSDSKRLKQLINEHWEIVQAIKNRDEEKAGIAMNNHMEMTLRMKRTMDFN